MNCHRRGITLQSLSLHGSLVRPLCYGSCHMGISTLYPLETQRLTSLTQPPDTNVDILYTASSKRTISSAPQILLSTTSVPSQADPFMCLGVATVARQSAQQVRGTIDSFFQSKSAGASTSCPASPIRDTLIITVAKSQGSQTFPIECSNTS